MPNGKQIVLEAPDNSENNFYIDGIKLDGKEWGKDYFKHGDLSDGARIIYKMSSEPNTKRGTAPEDRPYSFSKTK